MTRFSYDDIMGLSKIPRINLINSLPGFKSANLIGTINKVGVTNLAIFNSVIHLGASPPLMGFILRPATVPRHTYRNILETGQFTINHIHRDMYARAHQTSAKYEDGESEFDRCALTPAYLPGFKAPFVEESRVRIGLQYEEEYYIAANDTRLIVGKVKEVWVDEQYLQKDLHIDLDKAETVTISALENYHITEKLAQMHYARPEFPQHYEEMGNARRKAKQEQLQEQTEEENEETND